MKNDVIIVGAGLAGLTAALYAARMGLKTTVLEHMMPGGQVANLESIRTMPGFPDGVSGYELGPTAQMQAEEVGAEFVMDTASELRKLPGGFSIVGGSGDYESRAVILANGSSLRKLGVPGETEFAGRGVSTCASCDGNFFIGKPVVVVGGGDSALEDALELAGMGVGSVLIVHRGESFDAQQILIDQVEQSSGITVSFNTELKEIKGEAKADSVVLERDGEQETVEAEGIFIFTGLEPNTSWVEDLLKLDSSGAVSVDPKLMSSVDGVFAAGDIRSDSARQAIASAGDGATAALFAAEFLNADEPSFASSPLASARG